MPHLSVPLIYNLVGLLITEALEIAACDGSFQSLCPCNKFGICNQSANLFVPKLETNVGLGGRQMVIH